MNLPRLTGGLIHGDAAPCASDRNLPGTVADHTVAGGAVEKGGFRDPREFMNGRPHDVVSGGQQLVDDLQISSPYGLPVPRPLSRASRKATARRLSNRDQADTHERPPRQPYAHRT